MDPISFPAAIVSAWIIVAVALWGNHLHRKELAEGKESRGSGWFVLAVCGLGLLVYLSDTWGIPFLYNVGSDLIGGFLGLGSAYVLTRFVSSLRRGQSQPPAPRQ